MHRHDETSAVQRLVVGQFEPRKNFGPDTLGALCLARRETKSRVLLAFRRWINSRELTGGQGFRRSKWLVGCDAKFHKRPKN